MGAGADLLLNDPSAVERILKEIRQLDAPGEEMIYSPTGQHSYYRDLLAQECGTPSEPGYAERLQAHGYQVSRARKRMDRSARTRLSATGLEYRVTPDRTDGTGGYFSPPLWLDQLFATANRPGRVLSGLMQRFPLPYGVSQIVVPTLVAGTANQPAHENAAVADQDITDAEASSWVIPLAGQADVAIQLLEQSPPGAHLDWAIFTDLTEAYDADLEEQLIIGNGGRTELLGVTKVAGRVATTYTSAKPEGSEMWPYAAQTAAQVGDARRKPPECWLGRTARWFWLQGSEDTASRPFGLSTAFYLGSDDATPDPIGGLMGLPYFPNDAIPAMLGESGDEDVLICLRPRDQVLLEGTPQTLIAREPLSAALGVRLQFHCNVAALTARRPAGIGVLSGTGMAIQSGY